MLKKTFIKPAEGLDVKDPESGELLPPEGDYKTIDSYWQRRLNDNDVVEAKPEKKKEVIS